MIYKANLNITLRDQDPDLFVLLSRGENFQLSRIHEDHCWFYIPKRTRYATMPVVTFYQLLQIGALERVYDSPDTIG